MGVCTDDAQQPAHCRHQPDTRLAPVLLRDQEHIEERPERASYVCEQEVKRVERGRAEAGASWRQWLAQLSMKSEPRDQRDAGHHQHRADRTTDIHGVRRHVQQAPMIDR